MLINDKSHLIQYESLSEEEKDILRESCIRYIKNEPKVGIFNCPLICCTWKSKDIPNSLLMLMDNIKSEGEIDETLIKAISYDIEIPNGEISTATFKEYLRRHIKPFLDEELLIILVILYTQEDGTFRNRSGRFLTRGDFIQRIPFMISREYREFFIKVKRTDLEIGKYIVKSKMEIEDSIKENIVRDILRAEFYEFPESLF